jgi:hypothetical protein
MTGVQVTLLQSLCTQFGPDTASLCTGGLLSRGVTIARFKAGGRRQVIAA